MIGKGVNLMTSALAFCAFCLSPVKADEPQMIVGTTVHFTWSKGISADENVSLLMQCGIISPRGDIHWEDCEKSKGILKMPDRCRDFVEKSFSAGLSPLLILDYGNPLYDGGGYPKSKEAIEAFARYCEFVVGEFKGKCKLYQVWNEWEGVCMPAKFHGQGDPESYMKLLETVYPRIKAADPSATVICNSICKGEDYLKKLLDLGLLKNCDMVAMNPYKGTPEEWHERMRGIDKLLRERNEGREFPFLVTEIGWPTNVAQGGVTEEESADYLGRLFLLARTLPFMKGVWWYDFMDDGWDCRHNEHNFGMLRTDSTPKRSYFVMRDVSSIAKSADFVERIDAGDPEIWILRFREPKTGKDVIALWSAHKDDQWQLTLKSGAEPSAKFALRRLGEAPVVRSLEARDWAANMASCFSAQLEKSAFQVCLKGRPWIMEGNFGLLQAVKVERRKFPESERPKNSVVQVPGKIAYAAPVASQKTPQSYAFGEERDYRRLLDNPRTGKEDLDASFTARWDKTMLHLNIEVMDDVFKQDFLADQTWKGDGVQAAFQSLGKGLGHTDIDVALTPKGAIVYCRNSQDNAIAEGPTTEIQARISRNGTKITYEIDMPAKVFGLKELKEGMALGLSIVVNDNDGASRKGYLHWGDGIGQSKDPTQYNWIILED